MSDTTRGDGQNFGNVFGSLFDMALVEDTNGLTENDKPFMVKVTPGTDLYKMVKIVNKTIPDESKQKIVRVLAKAGYTMFVKSRKAEEAK